MGLPLAETGLLIIAAITAVLAVVLWLRGRNKNTKG